MFHLGKVIWGLGARGRTLENPEGSWEPNLRARILEIAGESLDLCKIELLLPACGTADAT